MLNVCALLSGTPYSRPTPPDILHTENALREELVEIERRRGGQTTDPAGDPGEETFVNRSSRLRLTALCLSGGGIRSAAFCLGVLQVLARKRLLNSFDCLSTVSGGGFIGGWLQMLLCEAASAADSVDPDIAAAPSPAETLRQQVGEAGAQQVQKLRAFTNYLTPHTGPFSADTWGGVALYIRNLLINWMVFAPLFLLLALLPIFYRTLIRSLSDAGCVIVGMLVVAGLVLALAAWQGCALLPSHRTGNPPRFATSRDIKWRIVVPALIWAWLVPVVIEYGMAKWRSHHVPLDDYTTWLGSVGSSEWISPTVAAWLGWLEWREWVIPAVYLAAMLVGFWLAWGLGGDRNAESQALYARNHWRWIAATLCAAFLIWIGLRLIRPDGTLYSWVKQALYTGCQTPVQSACPGAPLDKLPAVRRGPLVDTETALTVLFPLWLVGTHLLQTTFYVVFRKEGLLADLDREWLARQSGWVLRIGVIWTLFTLCCLVLPRLLSLLTTDGHLAGQSMLVTGTVATGLGGIAAWLGRTLSAQIEAVGKSSNLVQRLLSDLVLDGLGLLFGIGLLAVFGSVLQYGLGEVQRHFFVVVNESKLHLLGQDLELWQPRLLLLQVLLIAVLLALIFGFGGVNVNRFSMHAAYRNRLSRAFLGAARHQRKFDPFTGFDQKDNQRLAKFRATAPGQRLFPVINLTLNVTAGKNAAWAERKAECFVATPLVCGAAALRHPDQQEDLPEGAFVRTAAFAGMESRGDARGKDKGIRLGSMLTISGAAASPNWGYRSSRATAFLMTLFNVRLGAWLPNPAVATPEELQQAKPRNSIIALMSELLGATTDTRQSVYLSDGGHFENLGLYEMLRRRCGQIVLVDGGQDGDCTFFDLGNAIRKAAIDLNVQVKMRPMCIYSRKALENDEAKAAEALGMAMGDITYPRYTDKDNDKGTGLLLYLKPSFLSDIPAEVRAYGETNPLFPHDNTLDQWFTESQFESYRALGTWQTEKLTDAIPQNAEVSLDRLFEIAEELYPSPPQAGAAG
jgi:hypothetical protein